jgi:hypothetical protein
MARASLIGLLIAALVCAGAAGNTQTTENAASQGVAGIAGSGPVSLQSASPPFGTFV